MTTLQKRRYSSECRCSRCTHRSLASRKSTRYPASTNSSTSACIWSTFPDCMRFEGHHQTHPRDTTSKNHRAEWPHPSGPQRTCWSSMSWNNYRKCDRFARSCQMKTCKNPGSKIADHKRSGCHTTCRLRCAIVCASFFAFSRSATLTSPVVSSGPRCTKRACALPPGKLRVRKVTSPMIWEWATDAPMRCWTPSKPQEPGRCTPTVGRLDGQ